MKQAIMDYINQVEEATQDEMEIIQKRLLGCFAFCDTLLEVKATIENIFNVPVVKIEKQEEHYKVVVEGHLTRCKLSALGEVLNKLGESHGIKGIALDTVYIPICDIIKIRNSDLPYIDETLQTGHKMERFC